MGWFIFNSIIDHIPLWGWMVIVAVPTIVVLYFFGPILLPIWRIIPLPVRVALIGIGAAILAFLGGRYKGRANAEAEERARQAQAVNTRKEVDAEIKAMPPDARNKKLADRWQRD